MKTLVICLILSVIVAAVIAQKDCNPGETKKQDCNTCRCTNGLWSCSRKFCVKREKRDTICTPRSTFKKDCNTCVCNAQGTHAACTLKACL